MRKIILTQPPKPVTDQMVYNQAVYQWMLQTKIIIEQASALNDTPMNQNFVVTTGYALTTAISGTSTGTQVANFLCSFVNAMINKGLVTQAMNNI